METALGFSAGGASVVAAEISEARAVIALVARSKDGGRLHFNLESCPPRCRMTSRLDGAEAKWPEVFHRLAAFGAQGPEVSIQMDTAGDIVGQEEPSATEWAHLGRVASQEERRGIEELLGMALLSLEGSLAGSESNAAQSLLACLQLRGSVAALIAHALSEGSDRFADAGEPQGSALTALRTTVAEYYSSTDWEHVRLQLDGSTVAGVSRDSLTFKVFRTPTSVGLEFRPVLETGEHPFRRFPGTETDQFGQVYRITHNTESGELIFPDADDLLPADRELIDLIATSLYPTMRSAGIGVGHLEDSVYAQWVASGAVFSASYRLSTRPTATSG